MADGCGKLRGFGWDLGSLHVLSIPRQLPTCEALPKTRNEWSWPRFNASHCMYAKHPGSFRQKYVSIRLHHIPHPVVLMLKRERERETDG